MAARISLLFLCLALAVAIPFPCQGSPSPAADSYRVVIFHFNDLHGKIDALPKVARIVSEERRITPDVFLLVAGDSFSGNPVVDQYLPKGLPIVELFSRLGVELTCLGNHEFDYGIDILSSHLKRAKHRFLCANLEGGDRRLRPILPTAVLRTGRGDRVGIVGLLQVAPETGIPDCHPDKVRGLRFRDPLAVAGRYAHLKKSCAVMVALTHLGYDQDVLLAQSAPWLDVIVGGHSHTAVLDPREVNGVLVTQAGSNGRYLGRIDLLVERGRLREKKARLIDLEKATAVDPSIEAMVAGYNENPVLNRVIARTGVTLTGKDELGSLMTDALCRVLGLEIAFCNNGGIRVGEFPPEVTVKSVYQLDPFQNLVVRFLLSPEEIRSLIRVSFTKSKEIDLQVSGIRYTVLHDREGRVLDVEIRGEDGKPLAEGREYSVGLSSYIASAYDFEHRDRGSSLGVTSEECLIEFLQLHPDLARYRGLVRARARRGERP